MRRLPIVLFLVCLARPARLSAQTADEYLRRGMAWESQGEYDNAIADFNQVLTMDPKKAEGYRQRGFAWQAKGEHDKAIDDFNQVLAINPYSASVYNYRGLSWQHKAEYGNAIADYRTSLKIDPNFQAAYNNLGRLYATCPDAKYRDGKKAVENASKAYQLSGGRDCDILDTLAAAYAENGAYAKAQEFEQKAIELASEAGKQTCRSRLDLYRRKMPYREELKKK